MQIYHYHPQTKEYTGQGTADPSPLEKNVCLIPADATTTAPPTVQPGKVRVWLGDTWGYQDVPAEGTPNDPEYEPTLGEVKLAKKAKIRDTADVFLAEQALEYGAYEKLTWYQQAMEADALAADAGAAAPLVRSIAAARNMDPLELAGNIRANREQWVLLSGTVVGKRLAYQDALSAAQTIEDVQAINPIY